MIGPFPAPRTPYVCDQCGLPGVGMHNQVTCPRSRCQVAKRKRTNQRLIQQARERREAKRAST